MAPTIQVGSSMTSQPSMTSQLSKTSQLAPPKLHRLLSITEYGEDVPRMVLPQIPDFQSLQITKQADFDVTVALGDGTYSDVYLCAIKETGYELALKVYKRRSKHFETLFRKEANMLSMLNHNNVVAFHSICEYKSKEAILLELSEYYAMVNGENYLMSTLEELLHFMDSGIDKEAFAEFEHLHPTIASDVVEGLAYLHENGIAHLDLKSGNILLSNSELKDRQVVAKLGDFSESWHGQLDEDIEDDELRGTMCFIAPELINRYMMRDMIDTSVPDRFADYITCDIWSLAMLLHVMMNPNIEEPYKLELADKENYEYAPVLWELHKNEKRPECHTKYAKQKSTTWKGLMEVYFMCAKFDPSNRPILCNDIDDLLTKLHQGDYSDFSDDDDELGMFEHELVDIETTDDCQDSVEFSCTLFKSGQHVSWFKNGHPIYRGGHYDMESDGKTHTLIIFQVNEHSIGEYSACCEGTCCRAKLTCLGIPWPEGPTSHVHLNGLTRTNSQGHLTGLQGHVMGLTRNNSYGSTSSLHSNDDHDTKTIIETGNSSCALLSPWEECELYIHPVRLQLPTYALHKEHTWVRVMRRDDHFEQLKRLIHSTGLESYIKPVIDVSLFPQSYECSRPVNLEIDNVRLKWNEDVCIMHKQNQTTTQLSPTQWVDMTESSSAALGDDNLSIKLTTFSEIIPVIAPDAIKHLVSNILNGKTSHCRFTPYKCDILTQDKNKKFSYGKASSLILTCINQSADTGPVPEVILHGSNTYHRMGPGSVSGSYMSGGCRIVHREALTLFSKRHRSSTPKNTCEMFHYDFHKAQNGSLIFELPFSADEMPTELTVCRHHDSRTIAIVKLDRKNVIRNECRNVYY